MSNAQPYFFTQQKYLSMHWCAAVMRYLLLCCAMCVMLRCAALRCAALRCAALRVQLVTVASSFLILRTMQVCIVLFWT